MAQNWQQMRRRAELTNHAVAIVAILIIVAGGVLVLIITHAASPYASSEAESGTATNGVVVPSDTKASGKQYAQFMGLPTFKYGFDFSNQGPDAPSYNADDANNVPAAVTSAQTVLATVGSGLSPYVNPYYTDSGGNAVSGGSMMDISLDGFGTGDPQSTQGGAIDYSSLATRINEVTQAGGTPVISLVGAPPWMFDTTNPGQETSSDCDPDTYYGYFTPPCPKNYQNFANLAASVAQHFPQVKYFIVWNELKGFFSGNTVDISNYESLFYKTYDAIKAVRPDAQVGGPYAPLAAHSCANITPAQQAPTPKDATTWGCLKFNVVNAMQSFVSDVTSGHVGGIASAPALKADFICMDGGTEIGSDDDATLTDPVSAAQKYADVDTWLRGQTNLPLWWMESHIQPSSGWTTQQAAAARIAAEAQMATSGAAVGMQWQPQNQSGWADMGLWTSPQTAAGGQPTALGRELPSVLPILQYSPTLESGQPAGVLVVHNVLGTAAINTLNQSVTAKVDGVNTTLTAGQVLVNSTF